jgi:hypothetical protein
MKTLAPNRCLCGHEFPRRFEDGWDRVVRDGRIYARCRRESCGREWEAFPQGGNQYWIWVVEGLRPSST